MIADVNNISKVWVEFTMFVFQLVLPAIKTTPDPELNVWGPLAASLYWV